MMSEMELYWMIILGNVGIAAALTCLGSTLGLVITRIGMEIEDTWHGRYKALWLKFCVATIIIGFFGLFIPTTKQMAAIYIIPKIVNNQEIVKLPKNLVALTNEWIKDAITEKE